jgi:hypothetical protein
MPDNYRLATRLYLGLLVVGLGVLFTLDNLGLVNAREVLHWWPALLVVSGLMRMTGIGRRPSVWFGLTLFIVGGWMLLHRAGFVSPDVWEFWPVLLIIWGIAMIRGGSTIWRVGVYRRGRGAVGGVVAERTGERVREAVGAIGEARERVREHLKDLEEGEQSSSTFTVDVFLSSIARKVTSQTLTKGAVVAFLGGADVDLRSARMATDRSTLEVNLVMGGLNLIVPEDWVVEYQGAQFMGSVEDHSKPPAGEPRGRLLINGVVLLSSVVIKN